MMPIAKAITSNTLHQQPDFSCTTPGKCIVVGEHAVLRGAPAVVVPLTSRHLRMDYWQNTNTLQIQAEGPGLIPGKLLLSDFFEYALQYIGASDCHLQGVFQLSFNIPIASGLGTSACIAVAFARWCQWRGLIDESQLFNSAHAFENFFHGTSSGVDVAAVLYKKPLIYQKDVGFEVFEPAWLPMLFLSATGKASKTAESIAKAVKSALQKPCKGESLDHKMSESVRLAQHALLSVPQKGFTLLKDALDKAHECFHAWGLNQCQIVGRHLQALKDLGAVAVKQTGAGDGGYVLSLWDKPPQNPPFEMIRVF
jgi:mevalonate kinase